MGDKTIHSHATFLSPEIGTKKKRTKRSSTKEKVLSTDRRSSTKEKGGIKGRLRFDDETTQAVSHDGHHRRSRHFLETSEAVNSFWGENQSKCPHSVGALVPINCNWYDMFLVRRLGLENKSSHLLALQSIEKPHEYFALLAQTSAVLFASDVSDMFVKFLVSIPGNFMNLSAEDLLIFLSFFSFFPHTVNMLVTKNMLQNLVSSLLAMLTEKKDGDRLAIAIATLAYIVEYHPSMSGILSESNISQLLKLCTTRALYPVTEPNTRNRTEALLRSEYEIGASRLV